MGKSSQSKTQVTDYYLSMHYSIGFAVDALLEIRVDDRIAWSGEITEQAAIPINQPALFGGAKKEGGLVGLAYYLDGNDDQVLPDSLAAKLGLTGITAPAYRGLATVWFAGASREAMSAPVVGALMRAVTSIGGFLWSSNSPFVKPASFKVRRIPKSLDPTHARIGDDANPAHIVHEVMTNTEWGLGQATSLFNEDSFLSCAETFYDETFGLSLQWVKQTSVEAFVGEILDHVQATVYPNPTTGLIDMKAMRSDYDVSALREVDPYNAQLVSYQRTFWGSSANEIVVTWTNPINEEEETVSLQDLAAVAAQGGVVSDGRSYYAVRSAELAASLAERDLRAAASPLVSAEVVVDRSFWDIVPGEVIKMSWPKRNIFNLVMRVLDVDYGGRGDPGIKLTLLQDIFSLRLAPPSGFTQTAWASTFELPEPVDSALVFTLPAFMVMSRYAGQLDSLSYPEAVAGVLASTSSADTISYTLWTERPATNGDLVYRAAGEKNLIGRAVTGSALAAEATTQVLGAPFDSLKRGPEVGHLVFIGDAGDEGNEIALISAYDTATTSWVLSRGVLDTIPRQWPAGTPVWFVPPEAIISDDVVMRSTGETAEYKLLTTTSLGTLALEDAPVASAVVSNRPHAPLRPANVKVNGVGFGVVSAAGATALAVTWSNRNRTTEDGQVVPWTAGNVVPEYGQETIISVYRENGDLMVTYRGIYALSSYSIPIEHVQEEESIFIRVHCERDGLRSLQSYGLFVDDIPQVTSPAPPPTPDPVEDLPDPPLPDGPPTPDPQPEVPDRPLGGTGGLGSWEEP